MLTIRNNQTVEGVTSFDFEATRGQALSARASEAWTRSPFSSVLRSLEMGTFDPLNVFGMQGDEFISQSEAARLMSAAGVNVDIKEPFISRKKLDVLVSQKQKEIIRKNTIARGPQDGLTHTLGLFTELGMTMVDPINIASAFVPVVGEARFLQLVNRFGKTGARAIRGTAEGAVGAALVEPLVAINATEEQADYGFTNSLLNVAFGAATGGGLHVVGGAIADAVGPAISQRLKARQAASMSERIAMADPKVRDAALKSSIASVSEGRRPNPDLFLKEDPAFMEVPPVRDMELPPVQHMDVPPVQRMDVPETPEQIDARMRAALRESQQDTRVLNGNQKLVDEMARLDSPESAFSADMRASQDGAVREPGIKAGFEEEYATELLADAEAVMVQNSEMLSAANPELKAAVGIGDDITVIPEIKQAVELAESAKLTERAIKALVACLGRG